VSEWLNKIENEESWIKRFFWKVKKC
jgi:hypothetical protein